MSSGSQSRTKGQTGEREVAAIIRELTGHDVRRRVRQHKGDADLEGLPGWSVEVKRHASTPRGMLAQWWAQAIRQAHDAKELPVLFYRGDRADWRCVWAADLHLNPKAQTIRPDYAHTLDALPAAWWPLVRGLTR
jgi:hypothetical protein